MITNRMVARNLSAPTNHAAQSPPDAAIFIFR
jgi:hypothetical protein